MITVEAARAYYPAEDPAHDFDHVLRVLATASRLASVEGAELDVVVAAALLHDIGRAYERAGGGDHAAESARRAREILADQPADRVEAVAQAIVSHRFRSELAPFSLEAKVLYDADKLDSIGAIGVARAYAVAGICGQRLWAEVDPEYAERKRQQARHEDLNADHTPVHEFAYKLNRVAETLHTQAAREVAAGRHAFMVAFYQQLEREVQGEA